MPKRLKMPERNEGDGEIKVFKSSDGKLVLLCVQDGEETSVRMSAHNAWRAFGLLALMLEIPLPDNVGNAIKF